MTDSDRLDKIETTLEKLVTEINHLSKDVEVLKQETTKTNDKVEILTQEIAKTNDKVEIYQKASQQVVNLAFSLILTATIAIVVQGVINH